MTHTPRITSGYQAGTGARTREDGARSGALSTTERIETMSAVQVVPVVSDAMIDSPEDVTSALVKALYSHTGPVPDSEVVALVASVKSSPFGKSGDALVKSTDAGVESARAALVAARKESTDARAIVGAARVTMSRIALALTTKDVRGVPTMTQAEFAAALDVSQPYVSQVVSVARAMRKLGTTSPSAYSTLSEARKESAQALADTVTRALSDATKRTADAHPADGKSETGKAVPVRATVAEITGAREVVSGEAPKAPRATPRLSAIRTTLDGLVSGLADGATGTEDDRTRVLAILATLTTTVSGVTLV